MSGVLLPATGGPALFVGGFALLTAGCALLGVAGAVWRAVQRW